MPAQIANAIKATPSTIFGFEGEHTVVLEAADQAKYWLHADRHGMLLTTPSGAILRCIHASQLGDEVIVHPSDLTVGSVAFNVGHFGTAKGIVQNVNDAVTW